MSKKHRIATIVVKKCTQCPHYGSNREGWKACWLEARAITKELNESEQFPSWCPLKEVKDEM